MPDSKSLVAAHTDVRDTAAPERDTGEVERQGIAVYRVLRQLAADILSNDDLEKVLARCGDAVQGLLHADACAVALLDQRSGQLVPLLTMASGRTTTLAALPMELLEGRILKAIRDGRTLVVSHGVLLDDDVPVPLAETQSALAAMLIPLPVQQGMQGILWVGRIHGQPFSPEEQELAETIAALVVLAIRSKRVEARVVDEESCDALTGLPDRSACLARLSSLLAEGRSCALLMIDLDHFAAVNTHFGQQTGDNILKIVGTLLQDNLRFSDYAFRYDGDEFVLLLQGTDRARATIVAERLRTLFATNTRRLHAALVADQPTANIAPLAFSIGLAVAPEDTAHPGPLMALAEDALRKAKGRGGNRIAHARVN